MPEYMSEANIVQSVWNNIIWCDQGNGSTHQSLLSSFLWISSWSISAAFKEGLIVLELLSKLFNKRCNTEYGWETKVIVGDSSHLN